MKSIRSITSQQKSNQMNKKMKELEEMSKAAEGLMSLSAYKRAVNSQDGLTTPALHRPDKPVKGVQEPLSAFLMGSRDKTVIETAKHFFKGGL